MTEGPCKLPDGWRLVRLGEVCQINPKRPRLARDDGAPTSFVPMNAVDEFLGKIVKMQVCPFAEVRKGYTYFEEGDVLFAKITPCMENGKAAIAKGLMDGIGFGSTEFHVLRPSPQVVGEWVWHFVRQEIFRNRAKESFRGGVGQQRVPQDFLESQLLPLPPLDEQRRIVAKIEALMARIREAQALRRETQKDAERLMQAALAEVFPHLGQDLSIGWRWVRLGEVCLPTERRDPTKNPSTCFVYVDISAIDNAIGKIISPMEILGQEAPSRARKVIRTGDVIFATTRPYLKNIALVPSDLDGQICSTGFCVIRANREFAEPEFLFHLCRSDFVIDQLTTGKMRGASYPAVTDNDIYNTLIPLPPREEQRRIVAYLGQVQQQVTTLKHVQAETEAELRRLEQAILDKAFRGEL